MTESDPLVPVLAGLLLDLVQSLDESDDDLVDPDYAVKLLESTSWALTRLPQDQRDRFLKVVADLTEAEPSPHRREFLTSFPFATGLVEE
ncbi:hypothetical protein ACIQF6_20255 [Kitasatospora sp. NPDC092948]|uniref:hypothetical protein n=1 Tax=Kitasatospora sp. NPDC092948 TaxID=3364088 RepID=UPI0037F5BFCD